jgi:hypothetical protein
MSREVPGKSPRREGAEATSSNQHAEREEAIMTRAYFRERVTETLVFTTSATFLACYIAAKIAAWPWGACRF